MKKQNLIKELSFRFSIDSIELYKQLVNEKEFVISKQFLRSSTSIGANVSESLGAESEKDFIHKMHIALKEAYESVYWLELIKFSRSISIEVGEMIQDARRIIGILVKIIKSMKSRILGDSP